MELEAGHYRYEAAKAAGIHKATFSAWMERAEAGEEPYVSFAKMVEEAQLEAERRALATIREAANGWTEKRVEIEVGPDGRKRKVTRVTKRDWNAARWFLERRFRERWGERVEQLDADDAPVKVLEIRSDPALFAGHRRRVPPGETSNGHGAADGAQN